MQRMGSTELRGGGNIREIVHFSQAQRELEVVVRLC